MQLSDDDLREFIQLWSEEFQEPLSMEDARLDASALLHLYSLLASDQCTKPNEPSSDEVLSLLQKIE